MHVVSISARDRVVPAHEPHGVGLKTGHLLEEILLMHMDGDQCLILHPLQLRQIALKTNRRQLLGTETTREGQLSVAAAGQAGHFTHFYTMNK